MVLSKDTLYHYVACLEESYLIFPLSIVDRSVRKQAVNPKKLHVVDWALGYPFVPETRIDAGRKLETAVFLHWRRQRDDLGYLSGDREIDLVVGRDRPETLINVALSITAQSTWEREIGALSSAAEKHPRARRILVAHEHAIRAPPAGVQVIEAWRHLLGVPEQPRRAGRPKGGGGRRP